MTRIINRSSCWFLIIHYESWKHKCGDLIAFLLFFLILYVFILYLFSFQNFLILVVKIFIHGWFHLVPAVTSYVSIVMKFITLDVIHRRFYLVSILCLSIWCRVDYHTDAILAWVYCRCKYSIMLWQDDEEGDGERGYAIRHLTSWGYHMIIRQEDERTLGYNRISKIRTTWRLHLVQNPLEGWYEEQSISLMKMKHWTSLIEKKEQQRLAWQCYVIMQSMSSMSCHVMSHRVPHHLRIT